MNALWTAFEATRAIWAALAVIAVPTIVYVSRRERREP